MHIYESATVEPSGFDLRDEDDTVACPSCGQVAEYGFWETTRFGSLDHFYRIRCDHCGHFETDYSEP